MFQSALRAGGDSLETTLEPSLYGVSIRAPVRGATRLRNPQLARELLFQSAPPCGGRHKPAEDAEQCWQKFQSVPPCGGRPGSNPHAASNLLFQSAPPCGGRQITSNINRLTADVFQSAPPCGGRPLAARSDNNIGWGFNPRPRAGGDRKPPRKPPRFQSAPPCGGRPGSRYHLWPVPCFNPRPRAGGDPGRAVTSAKRISRFNPRPRAGGDLQSDLETKANELYVSIRAPVRGATRGLWLLGAHRAACFNPRPRAGGDPDWAVFADTGWVSIRAPVRGGDPPK